MFKKRQLKINEQKKGKRIMVNIKIKRALAGAFVGGVVLCNAIPVVNAASTKSFS